MDAKKIKAKTRDGAVEVTIPLPKEASKETIKITPTASAGTPLGPAGVALAARSAPRVADRTRGR